MIELTEMHSVLTLVALVILCGVIGGLLGTGLYELTRRK